MRVLCRECEFEVAPTIVKIPVLPLIHASLGKVVGQLPGVVEGRLELPAVRPGGGAVGPPARLVVAGSAASITGGGVPILDKFWVLPLFPLPDLCLLYGDDLPLILCASNLFGALLLLLLSFDCTCLVRG